MRFYTYLPKCLTSNFRFELNAFRRVTLLLCSTCPTSGSFSWLVRMPRQQLTTFSPTGFFDTFQQPCQEYKWVLQIARVSFVIHKIHKRRGKVKKEICFYIIPLSNDDYLVISSSKFNRSLGWTFQLAKPSTPACSTRELEWRQI